jgi:hypothetical protein
MKSNQIALPLLLALLPISAFGFVRGYIAANVQPARRTGSPHLLRLPTRHMKLKRHIKPTWDTTKTVVLLPRKSLAEEIAEAKANLHILRPGEVMNDSVNDQSTPIFGFIPDPAGAKF